MARKPFTGRTVTRRIQTPTPKLELFGDWAKTRSVFSTIDATMAIGASNGQQAFAKRLKKQVRRYIRTNGAGITPAWEPVSPKYAKFKRSLGYDPGNLYVLSGLYYRSIEIWGSGGNWYTGLKANTRHSRKGAGRYTLAQIARILESGSSVRNIKARPLWTPAFKAVGGNAGVKALVLWHVREQISKTYGIRPKVTI